jgi:hypothetical protein
MGEGSVIPRVMLCDVSFKQNEKLRHVVVSLRAQFTRQQQDDENAI